MILLLRTLIAVLPYASQERKQGSSGNPDQVIAWVSSRMIRSHSSKAKERTLVTSRYFQVSQVRLGLLGLNNPQRMEIIRYSMRHQPPQTKYTSKVFELQPTPLTSTMGCLSKGWWKTMSYLSACQKLRVTPLVSRSKSTDERPKSKMWWTSSTISQTLPCCAFTSRIVRSFRSRSSLKLV